jgi:hypothetical protein
MCLMFAQRETVLFGTNIWLAVGEPVTVTKHKLSTDKCKIVLMIATIGAHAPRGLKPTKSKFVFSGRQVSQQGTRTIFSAIKFVDVGADYHSKTSFVLS